MSRNRFSKLTALTQGAAVVGIGVAAVAACATVEPIGKDPSALPAPVDAPPAPSASAMPPAAPTVAPPATVNAVIPTQPPPASSGSVPVRGPGAINAITRGGLDAGVPSKVPMPNALPPSSGAK